MATGKASLFDNDEAEEDKSLRINKKFAEAYQSRKQKEELRKVQFEDLDSDVSSSESEDEDGALLTTKLDVDIMKTVNALRSKDPKVYDPSVRFFENEPEDDEESASSSADEPSSSKKRKPKRVKDVVREQILEQMNDGDEVAFDEERDLSGEEERPRLAYDEEQKELRKAFLESTADSADNEGDSDDEGLMIVKKKWKTTKQDEDTEEDRQKLSEELKNMEESLTGKDDNEKLVDPKGEIEDGNKFLLDYFKNRSWIDKEVEASDEESEDDASQPKVGKNDDDDGNDSDASLEQLDQTDDFEAQYNFRFEEAAAGTSSGADFSNISYARGQTMNTLRRKDETRKQKRLARKERKAAERKAKEEQLRRLKNAKRQEMEGKLKQIQSILGTVEDRGADVDEAAIMKLLEGDFDPEKFEALMQETYGEDFYHKEDAEWKTDQDVRESLKRDEDGELLVGQDEDGDLYDNVEERGDEPAGEEEEEVYGEHEEEWQEDQQGDEEQEEGGLEKKIKATMEDELYKLDYEDIVAGIPTRFKYRQVQPNNYGLTTEEILFARDTTLKQYVSLKNMAPYREESEHFVGSRKRRRFRDMLKRDLEEEIAESESAKDHASEEGDSNKEGDIEIAPRRKKNRRRLKKSKKSGETNASASEGNDRVFEQAEGDAHKKNREAIVEEAPAVKRRRKRSKKLEMKEGTPDANTQNRESEEKAEGEAYNEQKKLTGGHEKIKSKDVSKRNKKKRKKKSTSIEGVPEARLASYGF